MANNVPNITAKAIGDMVTGYMSKGTDITPNNRFSVYLFGEFAYGAVMRMDDKFYGVATNANPEYVAWKNRHVMQLLKTEQDGRNYATISIGGSLENITLPQLDVKTTDSPVYMDFDTRETFKFPATPVFGGTLNLTIRDSGAMAWHKFLTGVLAQYMDMTTYASKVSYNKLHCVVDIHSSRPTTANGGGMVSSLVQRRLYHSLMLNSFQLGNLENKGEGSIIKHTIGFKCSASRPLPTVNDKTHGYKFDPHATFGVINMKTSGTDQPSTGYGNLSLFRMTDADMFTGDTFNSSILYADTHYTSTS